MKTLTTTLIALITLVATVKANESNIEITSTSVVTATSIASNNNSVVLNFSAKNQASNSRLEIERSFYSNNFTTIASMTVAYSNNNNYRINDNAAELAGRKIAYYRVKQIAANGTVTYSNTMVVNLNGTEQNVTVKNTVINFTASENGTAVVKVQNITGKTVAVKNNIASKGNNSVELENGLAKGIYTATISVNGVVIDTQKIISE